MRIQHNIMAMNAYRNYNNNVSSLSANLEKLSSGYRINRAGDDAAGLAISEKMRAQITGLDAAQKNVKDGISLVKTAEGALQEVQDMMNRMVYLAEQSANGTYDIDVDRKALQDEVDALTEEIDRIAKSANFNGQKLLNGELSAVAKTTYNNGSGAASVFTAGDLAAAGLATGLSITGADASKTFTLTQTAGSGGNNASSTGTGSGAAVTITGGKTDILNTKTIAVKHGGTNDATTTAALDAAGNLTITLANTTTLTNNTDLQAAINGVLDGTASVTINATAYTAADSAAVVDAWGDVSVTVASTSYSASTNNTTSAKDIMTATALSGGAAATNATLTISDGAKSMTATAAATNFVDGEALTFTGSGGFTVTGAKIGTAANLPTGGGAGETIGTTSAATETAATTVLDYTGKTGADVIGTTLKLDGVTYEFVKTGATASGTNVAVAVAEDAADSDIATALQGKLATHANYTDNAAAADKWDADVGTGDDAAKITLATGAKGAAAEALKVEQAGGGLVLQIGDTSDDYNQLTISIDSMLSADLFNGTIDISKQGLAQDAIDTVKTAINTVSAQRGRLGAIQNRLEHTTNNLSVMKENITDAESSIRDTDVADEMMAYTKNNILIQSAQAMLAQANAVPQGVLQLLQ